MGAARSNRPTFSDSAAAVTKCWGLEIDETGESRKDRPSFRMADDEGRVLAAQSLGCDQHPYAVKQFGCQSKPETFNASNLGRLAPGIWQTAPHTR
jgi:hypothetical protein